MGHRLRHIWNVLAGNVIVLQADFSEGVIIVAIPTNTQTSLTKLQDAVARLIAKDAASGAAAAGAAQADTDTAAAVDAITAQIDQAAPPPAA